MTLAMFTRMVCLSSGVFGRPAWDDARCAEQASYMTEAAERHGIDPVLMLSLNVVECDMHTRDNPIYQEVKGRKKLVGFDACPMGVRIIGVEKLERYDDRKLYELAATRLERWKRWCAKQHRDRRGRPLHSFLKHYNEGNTLYADQVLAVAAVIRRRPTARYQVSERIAEIVRRLSRVFVRGWWSPNS